jgi:hypothetical protein
VRDTARIPGDNRIENPPAEPDTPDSNLTAQRHLNLLEGKLIPSIHKVLDSHQKNLLTLRAESLGAARAQSIRI